jgi:cytochrome o ubiquinol oxidase subunit 1
MPRNTSAGFLVSVFGLAFCFGFVWHIWWLAGLGLAAMIITFIARSYDRDVDYYVPAAVVERIEHARMQQLKSAH